jgi:hypothetical protein
MSNFTKTTDFAGKDSLGTNNPAKVVRGTEFDVEFNNLQTAVNSKANSDSPTFTNTVSAGNITSSGTVTAVAISLSGAFTGTIDGGSY